MRASRVPSCRLLLSFCLPLLAGCLPELPEHAVPAAATYRVATRVRYQLESRDFLLHVPTGYVAGEALPLVVVLHGAFSGAAQTERESGFSALAERERFLVAYPEGIGIFGWLRHWNAGHCCGKAALDKVDDVGYLAEVIAETRRRLAVDPRRVYLVGMSNGGMLAYRYAAERGGELAGLAVVSGALGSRIEGRPAWTLPPPQAPLPLLVLHGLADDLVPVAGGPSPVRGGRSYLPLSAAGDYWRAANGCSTVVQTAVLRNGMLQRQRWLDCASGRPVEFDLLVGWGHRWPTPFFTGKLPADDPLSGFDGSALIWEFFRAPPAP